MEWWRGTQSAAVRAARVWRNEEAARILREQERLRAEQERQRRWIAAIEAEVRVLGRLRAPPGAR